MARPPNKKTPETEARKVVLQNHTYQKEQNLIEAILELQVLAIERGDDEFHDILQEVYDVTWTPSAVNEWEWAWQRIQNTVKGRLAKGYNASEARQTEVLCRALHKFETTKSEWDFHMSEGEKTAYLVLMVRTAYYDANSTCGEDLDNQKHLSFSDSIDHRQKKSRKKKTS